MKNGVAIEVTYQAAGSTTGLVDVQMDVYDEGHLIDAAKSGVMIEIGSTGRYYKAFTPDAEGEWNVTIDSVTTPGNVVKHYTVVGHDIDSVGDVVAGQNDISAGDVAVELATYDAPTKAELDTTETNIRGADSDTLKSISDQIDGLPSESVAPPMVG